MIGCHFGDKKRLWLLSWVLSLLNRLLLWKWWTSAAVSQAAMWWGPQGWGWKISQATTTALTNTSVRQPEPPSRPQILHPPINCFQPLNLGAISCATKENKYNSFLLSPYYASGTVPCTEHYESWRWLSECHNYSHFQPKNLKSRKALVNLPKPIELENGGAGIWIEVLRGQSHTYINEDLKTAAQISLDRIALLAHA